MFKAHRLVYHSTLGLRVIRNRPIRRGCGPTRRVCGLQGYLAHKKQLPRTVGLSVGPYSGPSGARFLMSEAAIPVGI